MGFIKGLACLAAMIMALDGFCANEADAKTVLAAVQDKILSAKTVRVKVREVVMGVKTETRLVSKQMGKGVLSFRQETQALIPGKTIQPFIQVMDRNKLYYFPTGCGDVAVRMQFMEQEATTLTANLFLSGGKIEPLKDDSRYHSVRYVCTPAEVAGLLNDLRKTFGAAVTRDMIPAVMEYKIDKNTLSLSELILYSDRGRLVKRQTFHEWAFDSLVADSNFQIPQKYKTYTAKTLKEAEVIQAKLVKKAMADRNVR